MHRVGYASFSRVYRGGGSVDNSKIIEVHRALHCENEAQGSVA